MLLFASDCVHFLVEVTLTSICSGCCSNHMNVHSMLINKTKTSSWRRDEEHRCVLLHLRPQCLVMVLNSSITSSRICNDRGGWYAVMFHAVVTAVWLHSGLTSKYVTSSKKNCLNSQAKLRNTAALMWISFNRLWKSVYTCTWIFLLLDHSNGSQTFHACPCHT